MVLEQNSLLHKALETYSSREPTDCFRSPNTCLNLQVLFLFSYHYWVTLNGLVNIQIPDLDSLFTKFYNKQSVSKV